MAPDETAPINEHATIIEGVAHNGKPCRIVDNTGTIEREALRSLLDQLIADQRFGLTGLSCAGGNTIKLGAPEFTHLQIGETLYRFILLPYEARLETF